MRSRKRVLIIEDHDDSRRVLNRLLKRENYDVTDYGCCESADPHVHTFNFDIALLEVRLPGKCGPDFGRELRQISSRVMIVFLTGEQSLEPFEVDLPDLPFLPVTGGDGFLDRYSLD